MISQNRRDKTPEIIRRKIAWYIWKNNQRNVNEEYKKRYYLSAEDIILYKKAVNGYVVGYNWRNLQTGDPYKSIHNKECQIVADISENYNKTIIYKN